MHVAIMPVRLAIKTMSWKDKHDVADDAKGQSDARSGTYEPPSRGSFPGTAVSGRDDVYDAAYNGTTGEGEDTSDADSD